MKISERSLESLREHVAPLDTAENRAMYRDGRIPRADAVKDLDRRYRWDLFYASRPWNLLDTLRAEGLADSHIDTALRKIIPPLGEM